ncbi:MAG: hypothetical protein AB7R40_23655 [Nitrospiraceae bacterium]
MSYDPLYVERLIEENERLRATLRKCDELFAVLESENMIASDGRGIICDAMEPSREHAMQELADQAQKLNMGYGKAETK